MPETIAVYRKEHFNAAHRLYRADWDDMKNDLVFGKCNNKNFHGHNYELIIKVVGEIDPQTGYMIDLKLLSDIVKEHILKRFDHKNLNLDVPEFSHLNPTAENIAIVIYRILKEQLPSKYKIQIKLYETERNFVEYPVSI